MIDQDAKEWLGHGSRLGGVQLSPAFGSEVGRASDRFDDAGGFSGLSRLVRTGSAMDHIYAGTATGAHIAEYLAHKAEETRSLEKRRHLEWQRDEILSGAAWDVRISERTGALRIVVDPTQYSPEALAYLEEQEEKQQRRADDLARKQQEKSRRQEELDNSWAGNKTNDMVVTAYNTDWDQSEYAADGPPASYRIG